jgi:hypothetical protein
MGIVTEGKPRNIRLTTEEFIYPHGARQSGRFLIEAEV